MEHLQNISIKEKNRILYIILFVQRYHCIRDQAHVTVLMYTVYPPMEDLRISSHASLEKKVEQLNLEKKLVHDWRRRWQTNPILKISDWIGLPASPRAVHDWRRSWQTNPILKIRFGLVCQLLLDGLDWCSSFFTAGLEELDSIRRRNGVGRRSSCELNPIIPIQFFQNWIQSAEGTVLVAVPSAN